MYCCIGSLCFLQTPALKKTLSNISAALWALLVNDDLQCNKQLLDSFCGCLLSLVCAREDNQRLVWQPAHCFVRDTRESAPKLDGCDRLLRILFHQLGVSGENWYAILV